MNCPNCGAGSYPGQVGRELFACGSRYEGARFIRGTICEELVRLRAIVDKLPKCWRLVGEGDDRRLVQDWPMTPEQEIWLWASGQYSSGPHRVTDPWEVCSVSPSTVFVKKVDTYKRVVSGWAFNSREAAEFAAEAAKGQSDE